MVRLPGGSKIQQNNINTTETRGVEKLSKVQIVYKHTKKTLGYQAEFLHNFLKEREISFVFVIGAFHNIKEEPEPIFNIT